MGSEMCIRDSINGELEIYTCDFALIELANALRFTPGLSHEDVINAIESLNAIEINLINFNDVIADAIKLAFKLKVTVYDALYAALAEKLKTQLITYDRELLMKFKQKAIRASAYLAGLH